MNKEYFIKKAQETTANEFNAGWIYVGQSPADKNLCAFMGNCVSEREAIMDFRSHSYMCGDSGSHYFMKHSEWEIKFGKFVPQDKASIVRDKILNLKNELDLAEEELRKIEEEKKKDLFNENDLPHSVRHKKLSNGSEIAGMFGSVRFAGKFAHKGFFLGNNRHSTKWKIVEDEVGSQVLVPDLEK